MLGTCFEIEVWHGCRGAAIDYIKTRMTYSTRQKIYDHICLPLALKQIWDEIIHPIGSHSLEQLPRNITTKWWYKIWDRLWNGYWVRICNRIRSYLVLR